MPALVGDGIVTSSTGAGCSGALIVNWIGQATGRDTKKYRVGVALRGQAGMVGRREQLDRRPRPSALTMPRDAPPTRPPGAPRNGGL